MEDLALVEDGVDGALVEDASFAHFLHGEDLAVLLPFNFPHLTKATLPYRVMKSKVLSANRNVYLYKKIISKEEKLLPVLSSSVSISG